MGNKRQLILLPENEVIELGKKYNLEVKYITPNIIQIKSLNGFYV
jgi:hypothetical protein